MAKHFALSIGDGRFEWSQREESIAREKALDGIYVVRTSETSETLSSSEVVRAYKRLGNVEKAFRTFKGLDLRVRPIHHRLEDRVRAHLFLCMLAYYVEWHMRIALAPLLYVDEELEPTRTTRDPVARAVPSLRSQKKASSKRSQDGWPVRRWDGLLQTMATITENSCRVGEPKLAIRFARETEANDYQKRVLALLEELPEWRNHRLCPVNGTDNEAQR